MCNVPKKNATLDDSNAVKCSKCGLLYHPSCAKRAKINADGWVSFCCYSTAADEVNEVNDLDENSRVLFKLIEAKFNGLEVKFNGLDSKIDNTLITVKEKLCELDDRVLKLEDNNVYLLENVISEINKRNSKECNCIIYKLEDSENAVKKDIELFKNLLACCNDEPSFNINDIKLIRLGKKFKSGVDRPLKVVFPNKDCLHWFFHNKKMIIEKSKKSIIITGDLTNAQRDFRNKVLSEIKLHREKGEDNLFMKYINGIPTIVSGLLSYFRGLFGSREMRILILGLDGAGKTTILYRLQVGEVVTTIPTIGFNVEQVQYKNLKFQVWDLGGQTSIRPYWRCYYSNTDAIIYVVDSADKERIGISKDELFHMLREEELQEAILVVLANKQDMAGCMTVAEVHQALGLEALKNRTFQIFKTSATKGEGLDQAMDWLANALQSRK
ncbi:hypothetical protein FQA39_LY15215 [Lamprigera yunnana]|nr:hypothetical protein FQA39_LY15215 [Lamprigera yunnana]